VNASPAGMELASLHTAAIIDAASRFFKLVLVEYILSDHLDGNRLLLTIGLNPVVW
jgi:hypothetical protein